MANNINVEAILKPRLIYNIGDGIPSEPTEAQPKGRKLPNMMHINDVKAAIKEIVEAVIDKCAEKAKTRGFAIDDGSDSGGTAIGVDKDSILNVKKMISYE